MTSCRTLDYSDESMDVSVRPLSMENVELYFRATISNDGVEQAFMPAVNDYLFRLQPLRYSVREYSFTKMLT